MSDIGIMDDTFFYEVWGVIALVGAAIALIERYLLGRHLFWILLVVAALGGAVTTWASPFTFSGDDYYMIGIIVAAAASLMLAGYLVAALATGAYLHFKKRGNA
ncbi:hypothetical protein [Aestuariivirga litoralis]|uniref:hypothetical protein n=1 Tax=Aestuariivirga litoralis TaxID=2650924 RepID=UPI0018C6FB28|nr:hypothetical protein [Aestuariivirga litoralis]MBG1231837.1 hypothetical protein [Aestuariivirga litoralis]